MADNIANASKGFRRKEVRFQEDLNSFAGSVVDSGVYNVDIDKEMDELAEKHLFFNVGVHLLAGGFSTLRKSITGRTTV